MRLSRRLPSGVLVAMAGKWHFLLPRMPRLSLVAGFLMFIQACSCVLAQGAFPAPSHPAALRPVSAAPDIKASALWDGRKEVEFHSLNSPRMVKASDAHFLIDDEYVLG